MCGFTAVFSRNKNFLSHINLTKVLNLQRHRGPDAKGYIAEKNGFMFHNRLKIIDISNKIKDLISNGNLEKSGIFNKKNFFKKYDNYIKEKNLGNSFFIWKVLNTEFFLKNFQ